MLGLRAAGAASPGSLAYLQAQEQSLRTSNDIAIVALAEQALGQRNEALLARLRVQADGQIGETLNSTYWGVLALGHSTPATTRFMLARQTKAGGFAWFRNGQADSNDTAAALEALRVAGVHGRAVTRAVRFLRSFQNSDGGFELTRGRGSDAQSTAWAIQGLVAAGVTPPRSAFAYLARVAPARRQLSLLGAVCGDPGVGHVAGAGGAGEEAVSSQELLSHSTRLVAGT